MIAGCFLRMLSRGGMHVVNSGDAIRLSCEFYMENFNLFDNPVLWRKVQHQEEMQINMMGNILEPFESTRRFKVTFVPEPSKYVLGLYITCKSKFCCTHGSSKCRRLNHTAFNLPLYINVSLILKLRRRFIFPLYGHCTGRGDPGHQTFTCTC